MEVYSGIDMIPTGRASDIDSPITIQKNVRKHFQKKRKCFFIFKNFLRTFRK